MAFCGASKTWTQTLDLDAGPGPWKAWALKNLGSEKPGLWKTREPAGMQKKKKKKRLEDHMV